MLIKCPRLALSHMSAHHTVLGAADGDRGDGGCYALPRRANKQGPGPRVLAPSQPQSILLICSLISQAESKYPISELNRA